MAPAFEDRGDDSERCGIMTAAKAVAGDIARIQEQLAVEYQRALDAGEAGGFSDTQVSVLNELAHAPLGRTHVYGIQRALDERFGRTYSPSERAITNALIRFEKEGLVEKDPVLERNTRGPARQYYQVRDWNRVAATLEVERLIRERLVASLMPLAEACHRGSLTSSPRQAYP